MLGSQPSLTEKMYFRITARKKIGIEMPISEPTSDKWSNTDPYHFAARNPSGRPTPSAKIIATMASWRVAGKRCLISLMTERLEAMLCPRSPDAVVFR